MASVKIESPSDNARRVCFGDCGYVVTSLEIEKDEKSGSTAVVTYEVDDELHAGVLPPLGSTVSIMPGVVLSKATASSGEGGLVVVKLTFTTPESDDEEEDDKDDESADDSDDGSTNDTNAAEGAAGNKYGYRCSLDMTVTDEPLLCHPKFAGTTGAMLEYVKAFMDGARTWEKVPVLDSNGKPKRDKDGMIITQTLGSLLSGGGLLVELAKKGITTYKAPAATFSESYVSKTGNIDTSGVGQIGTPGGAPKFKGRDWLLISRNASLNDDGKTFTVSSVWMLSGVGGWDSDLYGN